MRSGDHAARQEVRTDLGSTLFVEAGAGTGKTTVLVDRIVNLVKSGAEMRTIAAITFTEAAATELRDRIRGKLVEADLPDAVAQVDEAAISTLHAFAQRILAEHPLEAGLPPAVEVLDEIQSALAFDERWAQFLDRLLSSDEHADVVLTATAIGLGLDALREVALVLGDHWDRIEHDAISVGPRPKISAAPIVGRLGAALAEQAQCIDPDDKLLAHLTSLQPLVHRLEVATSELEILHLLTSVKTLAKKVGRKGSWRCDIEAIRATMVDAESARHELLATLSHHVLTALLVVVRQFTLESAEARRREGRLEFHDLLVLARRVVRDNPAVLAALRTRFTHLLVDEFQDTDPLQVELAVMLAATNDNSDSWQDSSLDPGRLFFVGDAMQSIYRFRRADIRLFAEVGRFVANARHLTENYRSVPGILAWVNEVFGRLVGAGIPGVQPAYQPLNAARPPLARQPEPVALLGGEHAMPIAAVRDIEAEEIAETILRVRDEEWPVLHGGTQAGARPAQLHDIAILMPTRASLPQLESALEAVEIPYRVESASLVWGTQGVRDLLAALRAIDDPTDAVSLVAILRSPSFGCGDDDLLQFVQAGGRWDYRRDPPPALAPEHPVVVAMQELHALHLDRWWTSVSGLVERVTRQLHFFELAFAHRRPRDHWRRLRWVIDQARAFEEAGGGTLRHFVAWADRQADEHTRVKESALPEADDDAVRILTVHGAKGLQFPVVIVTGLNRPKNGAVPRPAAVLWDDDRPEVNMWSRSLWKGIKTAGFDELKASEGELDEQERIRLLYVALTRAENHLIISVHHKANDQSQACRLLQIADESPHLWRRLGTPPLRLTQETAAPVPVADPDAALRRRQWSASREALVAHLASAPIRAATAVAQLGAAELEPELEEPPWRRGRAGTSIGRAVHAVLQTVDLATGAGLAAIARAQASAEGVADDAHEVERLAAAALASTAVKEAVSGRHWRELYVASPVPGTALAVEGFVDLLYERGQDLVLIDYKTDSVRSDADVDATLGRYRLQAATYALALEQTLGRPVAECVFVFVSGGIPRERAIAGAELGAAKDDVIRLLAAG